MPDFIFPDSNELSVIGKVKQDKLVQNSPIFNHFPIDTIEADTVSWEQEDDWKGLQQLRGINGQPIRVQRDGSTRYTVTPGYYGDFSEADELELTRRRMIGTYADRIDISDLVINEQERLLEREIVRVEHTLWNIAQGTYSVLGKTGIQISDTFEVQTGSAAVPWATKATATPIFDFRELQLKARGKGVSFGPDARAYMNRRTFNALASNVNEDDLHGQRIGPGNRVLGLDDVNQIMLAADVPQIGIYDDGYYDDNKVWHSFIPDGKVIVIGRRWNDSQIGSYTMTANLNAQAGAGSYDDVILFDKRPPFRIEIHRGHNGAPTIAYPSALINFTAYSV